ncbi:MAG TPA: hypothetical protein EYN06_07635 [Myxococcales bacterium]|nr:hypothetical protein [Myxococcales bacterium]HIN86336.1 hypothetical protein [Myxococcales bacterium]
MRIALWLVAAMLVLTSCKKPQVEVEEEGPPLPLPMANDPAGRHDSPKKQPSGAFSATNSNDGSKLALSNACKLMTAHLKFAGYTVLDTECHNIRYQGESVRLENFVILKLETQKQLVFNACLWPMEESDGWEVGYVDTVNRPCVDREHYCKIGAGGSIPSLSFRGCGDGTERFVFSKRKLLEQLNGLWVMQSPNGGKQSVKIEKKGLITFKSPSNKPIRGQFKLVDSVTMDVQTDEQHGFILHFGLVDGALHLTRRELTHAKNAKSFLIIISERQSVRRFRGACYELHTPPRDYPITIECPIKTNEVGQTISIKLNDKRTISLYRRGEYWMEADGTAGRYTRARTKKKK